MFITEFADACTSIMSTHTDKRRNFNIHIDEPTNILNLKSFNKILHLEINGHEINTRSLSIYNILTYYYIISYIICRKFDYYLHITYQYSIL